MPPLIGISAYREQARWGTWDRLAVAAARALRDQRRRGRGDPGAAAAAAGIEAVTGRLDGLVLSGGGDIDPARYGAPRDPQSGRGQARTGTTPSWR